METSPTYYYQYADLTQTLTVRWQYNLQSLFLRSLEPLVTNHGVLHAKALLHLSRREERHGNRTFEQGSAKKQMRTTKVAIEQCYGV